MKLTIDEVINRKDELIALKKMQTKFCDVQNNLTLSKDKFDVISKTQKQPNTTKDDEDASLIVKIIANTYNWLDSHGDMHVDGCFTKSIQENKKIYHLDNHNHSFNSIVGSIESVEETKVNWNDLGVQMNSKTTCLIVNSEINDCYNEQVYDFYKNGLIDQHSVGMQYVNIILCANSNKPEDSQYLDNWNKYYPLLGNKDVADEDGYFWVVKEAKLKEVSCVLWNGSNELTPTLETNIEAVTNTSKNEPSKDTQKEQKTKLFINPNLF
jgi:hypothetical protein